MTEVKVGQEITFQPGMEMGSFTSKTLHRTFENIIFSGGIAQPVGTASDKPASPSHGTQQSRDCAIERKNQR